MNSSLRGVSEVRASSQEPPTGKARENVDTLQSGLSKLCFQASKAAFPSDLGQTSERLASCWSVQISLPCTYTLIQHSLFSSCGHGLMKRGISKIQTHVTRNATGTFPDAIVSLFVRLEEGVGTKGIPLF